MIVACTVPASCCFDAGQALQMLNRKRLQLSVGSQRVSDIGIMLIISLLMRKRQNEANNQKKKMAMSVAIEGWPEAKEQ